MKPTWYSPKIERFSSRSGRRQLAALVLLAIFLIGTSATQRGANAGVRFDPPSSRPANATIRSMILGYSVDHRAIVATEVASARASRNLLVVGSIAGDEPGGIAITSVLRSGPAIPGVNIWLVPDMNPDGAARSTRVNARGVDLNRNFPFAWQLVDPPGGRYNPGPAPLSEPESRAMAAFILRVRPNVGIWLHQPYGLIDDSEGSLAIEEVMAHTMGLPLERLLRYPGSAIGWEDHVFPNSAFDIELPGGQMTAAAISRYANAIRLVARELARAS